VVRRAGASVIRLAPVPGRRSAPPAPGPADAQCLLAA